MGCSRVNFTLQLGKLISLPLSDRPVHFITTVEIWNTVAKFMPTVCTTMERSNIIANISKLYIDIRKIYANIAGL